MPENLQNNPWFQLMLALVLGGAIIYVGREFFPNTNEMRRTIGALESEIAELQKKVNEGRELEARLPELEREIKSKQLELENLKKIIPSAPEAEDLIRKLERMAAETNIAVLSWSSQPKVAKEFYYEWPIALTTAGSYHNLGKFYSKISNYARIINVQGVRLTAVQSKSASETLNAAFTAVTYVYKEDAN